MRNSIVLFLTVALFASSSFAAQVQTKFIADSAITSPKIGANAVGGAKIRLENSTAFRGRNAADSADVNMFALTAADVMEFAHFPLTPAAAPLSNYQVANKKFVDDSIAAIPGNMTPYRITITLAGGDITAQQYDLAVDCDLATVAVDVFGVMALIATDLTVTDQGAFTRLAFGVPFATGGVSELVAGDKFQVYCSY